MRIALTGNPNSGKTTMYNALTGRNERVGNWAGVTVDKKESPVKKRVHTSSILALFPSTMLISRSLVLPMRYLQLTLSPSRTFL